MFSWRVSRGLKGQDRPSHSPSFPPLPTAPSAVKQVEVWDKFPKSSHLPVVPTTFPSCNFCSLLQDQLISCCCGPSRTFLVWMSVLKMAQCPPQVHPSHQTLANVKPQPGPLACPPQSAAFGCRFGEVAHMCVLFCKTPAALSFPIVP